MESVFWFQYIVLEVNELPNQPQILFWSPRQSLKHERGDDWAKNKMHLKPFDFEAISFKRVGQKKRNLEQHNINKGVGQQTKKLEQQNEF